MFKDTIIRIPATRTIGLSLTGLTDNLTTLSEKVPYGRDLPFPQNNNREK